MKKIFAIALALVMVLSMASAFAYTTCDTKTYAWNCPTNVDKCGIAKVKVVPFVKVNTKCAPYWEYQQNSCASAVGSTHIWAAYVLTVDANPNPVWFANENVEFKIVGKGLQEFAGLAKNTWKMSVNGNAYASNGIDLTATKEKTYYLAWVGNCFKWIEFDTADGIPDAAIFEYTVTDATKTKLCATYYSDFDALHTNTINGIDLDGYKVWTALTKKSDTKVEGNIEIWKGTKSGVQYHIEDGVVTNVTLLGDADAAFAAAVNNAFGLGCGFVCVTPDDVQRNFGWFEEDYDKYESCYKWGSATPSVVDPECKIEIPKTGDVSVVAYAVMALVAAAGAMGLKK